MSHHKKTYLTESRDWNKVNKAKGLQKERKINIFFKNLFGKADKTCTGLNCRKPSSNPKHKTTKSDLSWREKRNEKKSLDDKFKLGSNRVSKETKNYVSSFGGKTSAYQMLKLKQEAISGGSGSGIPDENLNIDQEINNPTSRDPKGSKVKEIKTKTAEDDHGNNWA